MVERAVVSLTFPEGTLYYEPIPGRVIGFDNALYHSGWAVVDPDPQHGEKVVAMGVMRFSPSGTPEHAWRRTGFGHLQAIWKILWDHRPAVVYLEGHKGVNNRQDRSLATAVGLGGGRMAVLLALPSCTTIKTVEMNTWRDLLCGSPRASKVSVGQALTNLGHLPREMTGRTQLEVEDVQDAVGVAVVGQRLERVAQYEAQNRI